MESLKWAPPSLLTTILENRLLNIIPLGICQEKNHIKRALRHKYVDLRIQYLLNVVLGGLSVVDEEIYRWLSETFTLSEINLSKTGVFLTKFFGILPLQCL